MLVSTMMKLLAPSVVDFSVSHNIISLKLALSFFLLRCYEIAKSKESSDLNLESEVLTTQIQGMRIMAELLNRGGSIKKFTEVYLQDTDNLQVVLTKMMSENTDIKESAFELLTIYLFTPKDMKSDDVNNLLAKNCDSLISVIEDDLEGIQDEMQKTRKKEVIYWLNNHQLQI